MTTLPVLPDGWTYRVDLLGPADAIVEIVPTGSDFVIAMRTEPGATDAKTQADTLAEALKIGQAAAREIEKARAADETAKEARAKALGAFGKQKPEPEPRAPDAKMFTSDTPGQEPLA